MSEFDQPSIEKLSIKNMDISTGSNCSLSVKEIILSKYKGETSEGKYHGKGEYTSKQWKYIGGFVRGKFDGFGTMYVEEGHFQGIWKNNVMIDGTYVFKDGLEYKHTGEKTWDYCNTKDRRFHKEVLEGISVNGPFLPSNNIILPPNLYDCGNGFYDSKKNIIISQKTGEEIRCPDEKEKNWIMKNCRIGI